MKLSRQVAWIGAGIMLVLGVLLLLLRERTPPERPALEGGGKMSSEELVNLLRENTRRADPPASTPEPRQDRRKSP